MTDLPTSDTRLHLGNAATSSRCKAAKTATPKKERLRMLLGRPRGATLAQLQTDLGWQPHTIRAAISGLRKGGLEVTLDQSGRTPVYRSAASA